MNLSTTLRALGSETRLRILSLLVNQRLSAASVFREYESTFGGKMHRESIYRALERLVDAKILSKDYDERKKQIVYGLRYKRLTIDLTDQRIIGETT